MPKFNQPIQYPSMTRPQSPIPAYISGRAANMAYQNDKARNEMMRLEAQKLMYGNSPEVRDINRRLKEAQIGQMTAPPGADYEAVQTGDNVQVLETNTGVMTDTGIPSKRSASTSQTVTMGEGRAVQDRADEIVEFKNTAQSGLKSYKNIDRAITHLDTGQVITGSLANIRNDAWKLLTTMGFVEGKNVAETESFLATTANEVATILSSGAFGSGTGLSDADREYAAKMAGASIEITEAGLRKILKIRKEIARADVIKYNKELALARQSGNKEVRMYAAGQNLLPEPPPESSGPPPGSSPQEQLMWLKSEYAGADNEFLVKEGKRLGIIR